MEKETQSIVDRITKIMQDKKMKQSAVARAAGLSPKEFCDLLHGRRVFRVQYVSSICESLGVDVNELFASDDRNAELTN